MTSTQPAARPLPRPNPDSAGHFAAAARGEVAVPQCDACRRFHWFPGPRCPHCGSYDLHWQAVEPHGVLHSYTVVGNAVLPWFLDKVPYVLALVELDGAPGVRLVTNLLDCDPDQVSIGMPLEAVCERLTEDIGLVQFRPRP